MSDETLDPGVQTAPDSKEGMHHFHGQADVAHT
jgi:hypothetical protein